MAPMGPKEPMEPTGKLLNEMKPVVSIEPYVTNSVNRSNEACGMEPMARHLHNAAQCLMPNVQRIVHNAKWPMLNAHSPMANARYQMHSAKCPMTNAQCPAPNSKPMHNAYRPKHNASRVLPFAECRIFNTQYISCPNAKCRAHNASR